jgi:tRNA G37 N-methylase Trm5
MKKYEIDVQTADGITLAILKDQRSYLKKELKNYKKGGYLHPFDVAKNKELIEALNLIIRYFGEE